MESGNPLAIQNAGSMGEKRGKNQQFEAKWYVVNMKRPSFKGAKYRFRKPLLYPTELQGHAVYLLLYANAPLL